MPQRIETRHTLHREQSHFGWNNAILPVARIEPGQSVEFHPMDAPGGQVTQSSIAAAVRGMIDRLSSGHRLEPIDVFMQCCVCADLRTGEIVGQPSRVVAMYFPRIELE